MTLVDGAPADQAESGTALRHAVRAFLDEEREAGEFVPRVDSWMSGIDPAFSRRLAARGWVGMVIPRRYGGGGRSPLERFVVTEELLAAGAPVAAHWIADRQMAPAILRFGTEAQRRRYLPAIATAEALFAIGMSEPDAGSDLASIRTRATRTERGWVLTGTKVWTTAGHVATAIVVLARTAPAGTDRHAGLSQFVVDLPNPRVRISAIRSIEGGHHFNECVFDDAVLGPDALLGTEGDGWRQVTAELANERSGPERVLSTLPLLDAWAAAAARDRDPHVRRELGRLVTRLVTLRTLSRSVAVRLAAGESPAVEAAMVKDLGTRFENDVVDTVRALTGGRPAGPRTADLLRDAVVRAPAFTLRGGTNEILRSLVARGLGLR
jgi:alkylation response protein AidB-like acyl-CoA dehydrogenase